MAATTKKARSWCFTLNNYTLPAEEQCQALVTEHGDATYIIYGREVGAEGTKHLQGQVVFKHAVTFNTAKQRLPYGCHIEPTKDLHASIAYCKKEGEWIDVGVAPKPNLAGRDNGGGAANQERWSVALQQARDTGEVEDAQIAFQHARTVDYIHQREVMKRERVDTNETHLWYFGASGTGKSRKARTDWPDAYLKMCNKWWDGFEDHDVVLIEDFDVAHRVLVHHLKIWADRYPFLAEKKGAATRIRPRLVIVTSNYHPKDIWSEPGDLEPILRRFKCVEFKMLEANDLS